jgi:hypothetical protein
VDLQLHPVFSTVPKAVESLPDGSQLWTYSNCAARRTQETCSVIGTSVICNGGQAAPICCYNQFLVQGLSVAWYRALGRCFTDCSVAVGTALRP